MLFADGAGSFDVIAAFPLKEGYSLGFLNFDVHKQKPQNKQLEVTGAKVSLFLPERSTLTRLRLRTLTTKLISKPSESRRTHGGS